MAITNIQIERERRAERTAIAESLDVILSAEQFNRSAVLPLAHRLCYAVATDLLAHIALNLDNRNSLVRDILERHISEHVRTYRIACVFGAAHHAWTGRGPFDLGELRGKLHSRDPAVAELARCVFAACGELVNGWCTEESRRVRAAFVLNRLVITFRDGAAP